MLEKSATSTGDLQCEHVACEILSAQMIDINNKQGTWILIMVILWHYKHRINVVVISLWQCKEQATIVY